MGLSYSIMVFTFSMMLGMPQTFAQIGEHCFLQNSANALELLSEMDVSSSEIRFSSSNLLVWSPDSSKVAATWYRGQQEPIQVWDVVNRELLTTLQLDQVPYYEINKGDGIALAWSPNSIYLAASYSDSSVRIWNSKEEWYLTTIQADNAYYGLVWFNDSDGIALIYRGIHIYDIRQEQIVRNLSGTRVFQTPDDWYFTTWIEQEDKLSIRSLSTAEQLSTVSASYPLDIAWQSGNMRLASLSSNERKNSLVQVWDLSTGKEILKIETDEGVALGSHLSPNGDILVLVQNLEIEFWDVDAQQKLYIFDTNRKAIGRLEWSPDGNCFSAVTFIDEKPQVEIFDAYTGDSVLTLADAVNASWSPDGTMLATTSNDGTLRIWGVAEG